MEDGGGGGAEREARGRIRGEREQEPAVALGPFGPQADHGRVGDALAVERQAAPENVDERVPHEQRADRALGEVPPVVGVPHVSHLVRERQLQRFALQAGRDGHDGLVPPDGKWGRRRLRADHLHGAPQAEPFGQNLCVGLDRGRGRVQRAAVAEQPEQPARQHAERHERRRQREQRRQPDQHVAERERLRDSEGGRGHREIGGHPGRLERQGLVRDGLEIESRRRVDRSRRGGRRLEGGHPGREQGGQHQERGQHGQERTPHPQPDRGRRPDEPEPDVERERERRPREHRGPERGAGDGPQLGEGRREVRHRNLRRRCQAGEGAGAPRPARTR